MTNEQLIEEAVKEFDKVFPCIQEGCDNYGTIPEQDGNGDWQPAQCEFCYKIRFPVKEYFEKSLNTITSKSAEGLLEDFTEYCHTRYLGSAQNSSAKDGFEYSYDNEIINMIGDYLSKGTK